MNAEDELRRMLQAEAERTPWSLTLNDVTSGEIVDNVVPLDAARARRRSPVMLGAAAGIVGLLAGGSYLATHRTNSSGRVIASGPAIATKPGLAPTTTSGPATKVASASASTGSIFGQGPSGPVSLDGITLVLPKNLSTTYRIQGAYVQPVGAPTGRPSGVTNHLVALRGATSSVTIIVNATGGLWDGGVAPAMANDAPLAGDTVKVHGVDAQIRSFGTETSIAWLENGVHYSVFGRSAMTNQQITRLANSIIPGVASSAAFTMPTPDGYTVTFDGDGNVTPAWSYNVQYLRENLDKPQDESISIDVHPTTGAMFDYSSVGADSKTVKVAGIDAQLTKVPTSSSSIESTGGPIVNAPASIAPVAPSAEVLSPEILTLTWQMAEGVTVALSGQGFTEAEIIAFAESIAKVDEATFRAAVGDSLKSNASHLGPDFSGPNVSTFTGTTDGRSWTLKAPPLTDPVGPEGLCIQIELSGGGGSGDCGAFSDGPDLHGYAGNADGYYFGGVVSAKVMKVVVRDSVTNKDVVSVDTVAGPAGDDRRAYVIFAKPLPVDTKTFLLVGLDAAGTVVGSPMVHGADEYPGNQPDPSVMPPYPTTIAPASGQPGGSPDAPSVVIDPATLPMFAKGTFEGRTWDLRKPPSTWFGDKCWVFAFAAGALQPTCSGGNSKIELTIVHDRRVFVVVNAPSNVKVQATFKDGRVVEAEIFGNGTDRVAVIGIGLKDELISIATIGSDGNPIDSITGTLPGDTTKSYDFGGQGAQGGQITGFGIAGSATVAPTTTGGKP